MVNEFCERFSYYGMRGESLCSGSDAVETVFFKGFSLNRETSSFIFYKLFCCLSLTGVLYLCTLFRYSHFTSLVFPLCDTSTPLHFRWKYLTLYSTTFIWQIYNSGLYTSMLTRTDPLSRFSWWYFYWSFFTPLLLHCLQPCWCCTLSTSWGGMMILPPLSTTHSWPCATWHPSWEPLWLTHGSASSSEFQILQANIKMCCSLSILQSQIH